MGNTNSQQSQPLLQIVTTKLSYCFGANKPKAQSLCILALDGSLTYDKSFLEYLQKNENKEIKIVTIIGETGTGKSTILNMILNEYMNELNMVFNVDSSREQVTQGIDYYTLEQGNKLILILDCQGLQGITIDDIDQNSIKDEIKQKIRDDVEFEIKLTQLQSLICSISTCTFYVTNEENRILKSYKILMNQLDIDKNQKYENNINNLCKIINNSAYEYMRVNPIQLNDNRNYFEKPIKKILYLTKCNQQQNSFDITPGFKQTIQQLREFIDQSTFKAVNERGIGFQNQQTCINFHDVLENAFEIINEGFEKSSKNFLEIVNLQLLMKQEFRRNKDISLFEIEKQRERIQEILSKTKGNSIILYQQLEYSLWQKQNRQYLQCFDKACKIWEEQLIQKVNEILSSEQNQQSREQLLKKYLSLDSIKPFDIRFQAKIREQLRQKMFMNDIKLELTFISILYNITHYFICKAYKYIENQRRVSLSNYLVENISNLIQTNQIVDIQINDLENILQEKYTNLKSYLDSNVKDIKERQCFVFLAYFNFMGLEISQIDQKCYQSQQKTNLIHRIVIQQLNQIIIANKNKYQNDL